MDLGAFVQIEDLEHLMDMNGIVVPRLRGLRLMRGETPVTSEELEESITWLMLNEMDNVLCANPPFTMNPHCFMFCPVTDRRREKYMRFDENRNPVSVRWDRLHGKKRKAMKYAARKARRNKTSQIAMYNKYAGMPGVLYIHSRIGAGWHRYRNEPWFLDAICDAFDSTYCDIYAKIDEPEEVKVNG